MKEEQKHTPTPWKLKKGNDDNFTKIVKGKKCIEFKGYGFHLNEELKDAEFIYEAITSYHTLKQQNEQLTAQLEKERKDKEAMVNLLKEEWNTLNDANVTYEQDGATNDAWYIMFKLKADRIKSVLTNSGITI